MAENFIAEAFSLLAISLVVIALRWLSRVLSVGFRKLAVDDYLMIVAGALYSAETTVAYYVGNPWKGLANSGMTPEYRAALDPQGEEYRLRVGGSKNQLVGWLVYTVLLWTLKTCMLIFYSRLTDGVNNMRIRIRIGAVLLAVSFLATFLTILLGCLPIHRHWQINPDPGSRLLPTGNLEASGSGADNSQHIDRLLLDMIWGSRLATKRKWVLSVMFSGGILVMVAGILRCVLILTSGANGPQQAGEWSIRESFIAVVVGNLPMLYTLFQRIQAYGTGSFNRSSGKRSHPLGSYRTGGSSRMGKKPKKFHHPLSMPNDTAMDSDERIVVESKQGQALVPSATASGGLPPYHSGGDQNRDAGIRVQTDLHVESSEGAAVTADTRHDWTRYPDSRQEDHDVSDKQVFDIMAGMQEGLTRDLHYACAIPYVQTSKHKDIRKPKSLIRSQNEMPQHRNPHEEDEENQK
ncbi:MAG: hypothetical protein Q9201_000321 [Fulgogasparrea decipioides]